MGGKGDTDTACANTVRSVNERVAQVHSAVELSDTSMSVGVWTAAKRQIWMKMLGHK